jgi:hypothetical protein
MSAGTEIMITIRPGDTGIGGTQQGEAADAPSPRPDMTEAFAVTRGEGEAPPAPIDAMGAAGLDTGAAPAPTEGAISGASSQDAGPGPAPTEGATSGMASRDAGPAPAPTEGATLGAASLDAGPAPAPTEGATSGAAAASALPEPVPLEEIEQLGSLEGTASGQEDVPEPQGDAE